MILFVGMAAGQSAPPAAQAMPNPPNGATANAKPTPPCQPNSKNLHVEQGDVFVSVDGDTNIGSAVFKITYDGANCPITLHLSTTDFVSTTTGKSLGAGLAAFTAADGASKPFLDPNPTPMKKGDAVMVKIEIAKLWEAGESTASLQQDGTEFARIRASKLRVPFSVKTGTSAGEDDGVFYPGREGSVAVLNDDAMTYPVFWELWIGGKLAGHNTERTLLAPKSTTFLRMTLSDDFFTWPSSGMLQDDIENAKLIVRFAPTGTVEDTSLPNRPITYKFRLRYFSKGWQQGVNLLWVIFFLAVGAVISIALNIGIPNQVKRNAVRTQIRDLSNKINALEPADDSSTTTFLRVERSRLEERLHESYWFSPNLSAELPLIQLAIDLLNGRVRVVAGVRDLQETLRAAPSVPPSVMDTALAACQKTLKDVMRPDLCPPEIAGLEMANTTVQQLIASLGQVDPVLEPAIQARETEYKAQIPSQISQDPDWKIFANLAPIFANVSAAAAGIAPDQYFDRDMDTQITGACLAYVKYRKMLSDPTMIAAADKDAQRAGALLQLRTYADLVKARSIFDCIRENVTSDKILQALKANQFEIVVTPSTPSTYELVWLRVRFLDQALNTDAVRQQLTCKWMLGNVPKPKYGYTITHYFTGSGGGSRKTVEQNWAQVEILYDMQDAAGNGGKAQLRTEISVRVQRSANHVRVELVRTGLALFVALLGLIASAQDKIANLPIVSAVLAVLVIGIMADSIKNLLAK
jgi:hypothetical protein